MSSVSGSSSPLYQFSGLASGLDTQSIIEATIEAFSRPKVALEDQRDELDFTRTAFRDLNDQLYKLQQASLALRLESTFRTKLVKSSDETVVTATATTEAARGTYTVKVKSIAEAAMAQGDVTTTYRRTDLTSTAGVSAAGGEAHDTTEGTHTVYFTSGRAGRITGSSTGIDLERTLGSYGVTNATGFAVRVAGSDYTIHGLTADSTVAELVSAINTGGSEVIAEVRGGRLVLTGSQGGTDFALVDTNDNYTDSIAAKLVGATGARASVAELIGARSVTAGQTLSSLGVTSANSLRIIVGNEDQTVTFAVGATVQQLADQINTQFAGVEAAIVNSRLVIRATRVGQGFEVLGTDYSTDAAVQVLGIAGRQSTQTTAVNAAAVTTSASSGARIVGGVLLTENSPLSTYGVVQANGMKIIAEDGSTFEVSGLTGTSTVADVVDRINAGSGSVRAQVIGGRLVLSSVDGGRNFTVQDVDETGFGLASQLLGLASPAAATDIAQSTKGVISANAGADPSLTDASDGQHGTILGQRPTAGAVVLTNTLDSYGVTVFDGFTVTVNRVDHTLTMASGQTVQDLVDAINAIDGVRATVYDGRLRIEAADGNADIAIRDSDYATGIAPSLLGATAAKASVAQVTGAVSGLTGAETLTSLGITSTDKFTLVVAGASKTLTGLTGASTVTDLISAVNSQVATVTAALSSDGRLVLSAAAAHVNFVITDTDYATTIAGRVLGLRSSTNTLEPPTFNGQVVAAATGAAILGPDVSASGGLTTLLSAFGVTATNGQFLFTVRGETLTVNFDATQTLGTLLANIDALNGIRADFVGGRVLIAAEDPREDFSVAAGRTTYGAGNGFRELLGLSGTRSTTSASTNTNYITAASTGDYTAADLVVPTSGGSPEFHAQVGGEGVVLSDLYEGGMLQGTGVNYSFKTGTAYLFTSAELVPGLDTTSVVESAVPVGQRDSFSLTKSGTAAGVASSLVGSAVFEEALAGSYSVVFVTGGYVIQDANGNALGAAVADGATFTSYADSALAGSSFTFTSTGAPAPAVGAKWTFTLGIDVTKSLSAAGFRTAASTATNGSFTINGKVITIGDYTKETVESVLAKINSAGAGVIARYDPRADQFLISSVETGKSSEITMGSTNDSSNFLTIARIDLLPEDAGGGGGTQTIGASNGAVDLAAKLSGSSLTTSVSSGTFTINGVKLYVDRTTDTLQSVIDRINASAAGVVASYDSVHDRLILRNDMENPNTRSNTVKVNVGSGTDTSNFLVAMRLITSGERGATRQVGTAGTDATVVVNGITYTRTTNTIDDIVAGLTLTLTGTSARDQTSTLTVEVDTDRALTALSKWIAEWNTTVFALRPDVLTTTQKKYLTKLTDDERQNMTFSEIEEYEALWKLYKTQEIYRTDTTAQRLFYTMRSTITDPVAGLSEPFNALADVGIETYTALGELVTKGELVSDSVDPEEILEKLKENSTLLAALRDNSEEMYELFGATAYAGSGTSVTAGVTISTAGITIPEGGGSLRFRVSDGTRKSTVISLEEGRTYTRAEILELLDRAGLGIGDDEDEYADRAGVTARIGTYGALSFGLSSDAATGAKVWFEDLSTGTNTLGTVLGITIPDTGDGIARYVSDLISRSIKSDGILGVRTKIGGSLDTEISSLEDRITQWERRIAKRETDLNDQYTRLEATLARLQQMGSAISSLSSSLSTGNSNE